MLDVKIAIKIEIICNFQNMQDQNINSILHQLVKEKRYRDAYLIQLKDAINGYISSELSPDAMLKFINDLNRKIFELIHGNDSEEKKCGILIINELIDIDTEDNTVKLTRFCNYLRMVLPCNDIQVMELAAKAMGKLSSPSIGGSLAVDLVEFEIKRSLEWLNTDKSEFKRYAAVLLIREIASNASTILYGYMSLILDSIWTPLRDQRSNVRLVAFESFSVCLSLIQQRESQQRDQWYKSIYIQIQLGFRSINTESLHSSFLAILAMTEHATEFMLTYVDEVHSYLLKYRDYKDPFVRDSILSSLPLFAKHYTSSMSLSITEWMDFLLASKKDKDKSKSLVCCCELACYLNLECKNYVDTIIKQVKELVNNKNQKQYIEDVFACIRLLAKALPAELSPYLPELIHIIFSTGLSFTMRQTLTEIALYIPSYVPTLQDKLINLLSLVLTGHPYRPLLMNRSTLVYEPKDPELIILALNSLSTFQMPNQSLADFLQEAVVPYLDFDDPNIRSAAAQTICQIINRDPIRALQSQSSFDLIYEILVRLVTIAIADPDQKIRFLVMHALSTESSVDHVLSQSELIRAIFLAVNDEYYPVRHASLSLIGRLSKLNPAYVMPCVRKVLFQLLSEIEFSAAVKQKEDSAKLLTVLIKSIKELVKPYVDSIFRVLLPKMKDPSSAVSCAIILAIGQLSLYQEEQLLPFLDELMLTLLSILQDQSSIRKREASLKTMRLVITATNNPIQPYFDYPSLMDTLLDILKTEQSPSIRKETMRLLGHLGALDPTQYKLLSLQTNTINSAELLDPENLIYSGITPSSEEYYPTVAIYALLKCLKDQSLSIHHTAVVQAILYIFKTLGLKCTPFLQHVMPPLLYLMQHCQSSLTEFYCEQCGVLVKIVQQHIRPFLPQLFQFINADHPTLLYPSLLHLLEAISGALDGEFKSYIPHITPFLIQLLQSHPIQVCDALLVFGPSLEAYFHLLCPSLLKLIVHPQHQVQLHCIITIGSLSQQISLSELMSQCLQPLLKLLQSSTHQDIIDAIVVVLTEFALQCQFDYLPFSITVHKSLMNISSSLKPKYLQIIEQLKSGEPLPIGPPLVIITQPTQQPLAKLPVNQQLLKRTWQGERTTADDWLEWLRRLSIDCLKESPSHALRACSSLASVYFPISRELFNAAFLSCWSELYDQFQDELVNSIEHALLSPHLPPEVLQYLLNLFEFMEHAGHSLPIDIKTLGSYAQRCHAYAKALHYKELEYQHQINATTIEALIQLNNQLNQPDVSLGLLKIAHQHNIQLKSTHYEKLGQYDEALKVYDKVQILEPNSIECTLGRLRCLNALSEWETIASISKEKWSNDKINTLIAPYSANASWHLNDLKMLQLYTKYLQPDSPDMYFFSSIINIQLNHPSDALLNISHCLELLDTELTALVGESYERAYSVVVRIQMLIELEEIIQAGSQTNHLLTRWHKRLQGMQQTTEIWQKILKIRQFVAGVDVDTMLSFINTIKYPKLALQQLTLLFGVDPSTLTSKDLLQMDPKLVYHYIDYQSTSNSTFAIDLMQQFSQLQTDYQYKAYYKVGLYKTNSMEYTEQSLVSILQCYKQSIDCQETWDAYHQLAITHYEALLLTNSTTYVLPAIHSFFKAIQLQPQHAFQDVLRLLTLWFKYQSSPVNEAIKNGIDVIPISTWTSVIPQLLARLDANTLVVHLLEQVGQSHPQSLVYNLAVATKSSNKQRKQQARVLMRQMQYHSGTLVQEALLISEELIRVAILLMEQWHHALEEASRVYFGENNAEEMLLILEPLHEQFNEHEPETNLECQFHQSYTQELQQAWHWCMQYKQNKDKNCLNQAWECYFLVFKKINKQLPLMQQIELEQSSPKLFHLRDSKCAVPGTLTNNSSIILIHKLEPLLTVITSKQRPRKLIMIGSDGLEYPFLLKGHEDLRQDERVMQLFQLINHLLGKLKSKLSIQRYAVVPLSPNSGLLTWVSHCDTLHSLIRDYREQHKILLNIEHRLMLQQAPSMEQATLIQKMEVFEYSLANTNGNDLYKVLWLKSKNSENWLDRRSNYTRSLATMSMVGYILGLGDRHPSNLMLNRFSGKIVHIDFGDCFEVAMLRDKYPEKIPFRLTRMMIQAMEVSGIEGSFRKTCEVVMDTLRKNKDSMLAVLEAFVYDPLINWRLAATEHFVETPEYGKSIKSIRSLKSSTKQDNEFMNERAVAVINRVQNKLNGRDFKKDKVLDVEKQVDKLINQATNVENLCQLYVGWCAFW